MKLMTAVALALAALVAAAPAGAAARDRDHDGLPDRWERQHGLSTTKKSANGDPDRDRVDNGNEFREGTNPRSRDSNHNGRSDGREDRDRDGLNNAGEDMTGNDPIDPDTDDDGVKDGKEQAGTVVSFTDGVLVIKPVNGDPVSARVTDATEVKCENENEAEDENRADDHRGGRSTVSREGESGDDHGGRGSGDDHGGRRDDDSCPAGALKAGALVHEAELEVGSSGAVWHEVKLITG